MTDIPCFMLEATGVRRLRLRRFTFGKNDAVTPLRYPTLRNCAKTTYRSSDGGVRYWGHDASTVIEERVLESELRARGIDSSGDHWPHEDPRWPKACEACGEPFQDTDEWQLNADHLWRDRRDGATLYHLRRGEVPSGAMWNMDWLQGNPTYTGPDGLALAVMTPGGEWYIDGPARDGGRWTRTGTPPAITVMPSILAGPYHGWLRDGHLVDA